MLEDSSHFLKALFNSAEHRKKTVVKEKKKEGKGAKQQQKLALLS